jgi:hypothetical protein
MDISITFSIPLKARLYKKEGLLLYLGVRKWLFNFGKSPWMIWFRIFGFTFTIGYWSLKQFEFSFRIW